MDRAFGKSRRLLTARDYRRVFDKPTRRRDTLLTILAKRNALDWPRLGLAISKKSLPKAVDRNRIKRLVRETFRCEQARMRPVDLVVLAHPRIREAPNPEITRALRGLLRAAGALAN